MSEESSFVTKARNDSRIEHIRFVVTLLEKSKDGAYPFLNHANQTSVYLLLDIIKELKERYR